MSAGKRPRTWFVCCEQSSKTHNNPRHYHREARARFPRWVAPLGAAALGAAVTLVAAWGVLRPAPAQEAGPGIRFEVSLPQGWEVLTPSFGASGGIDPSVPFAVSPDGLRLAIVGLNETGSNPGLRATAGVAGSTATGRDARCHLPFWSPDGRSIGFFADGQLRRIGADGGIATYLCDASPAGHRTKCDLERWWRHPLRRTRRWNTADQRSRSRTYPGDGHTGGRANPCLAVVPARWPSLHLRRAGCVWLARAYRRHRVV